MVEYFSMHIRIIPTAQPSLEIRFKFPNLSSFYLSSIVEVAHFRVEEMQRVWYLYVYTGV